MARCPFCRPDEDSSADISDRLEHIARRRAEREVKELQQALLWEREKVQALERMLERVKVTV